LRAAENRRDIVQRTSIGFETTSESSIIRTERIRITDDDTKGIERVPASNNEMHLEYSELLSTNQ
jgi:hypothetical protein